MMTRHWPVLVLAAVVVGAAVVPQDTGSIPNGATLPGTCTAGTAFYLTTAQDANPPGLYYCLTTNTWEPARPLERIPVALAGGAQGPPGPAGPQGPQGDPGAAGSPGAAGEAGAQGEQGSQGVQGNPGAQGSPGADGAGIVAGVTIVISSGSCPIGYAEDTTLNGKFLLGTVAANADIGTTGGADAITPAGSVTWPAGVPAFTGTPFSGVINHTHLTQRYPTATGTSTGFTIDTSMSGTLADNTLPTKTNTGGVASITPGGTNAWPAGVPTFAGTQADNRPAYTRVIFCKKT